MITFAVFLVNVPEETAKSFFRIWNLDPTRSADGYLMFDFQYTLDCLGYLKKSIEHHHPDARLVVLTDKNSSFPRFQEVFIRRYDLDVDSLALAKMQAYSLFLDETSDSDIIFLDSDMLVQDNLEFVFKKQFDVGLTFLPSEIGQNIGSSLFFFPQNSLEKGRFFLHAMITRFEKYGQKLRSWFGDQQCLLDYFKKNGISVEKRVIENAFRETSIPVEGIHFLLFPGHLYNWTYIHGKNPKPPPYVVHFKGGRKTFMPTYFQEHWKRHQ